MNDNILQKLPGVQENVPLSNYTTFKIGGPARYFFVAKNKDDIISALAVAKEFGIPYYIIGGGSNLLVSDEGFDGLIIRISAQGGFAPGGQNLSFRIEDNKIIADAGVGLSKLVIESVNAGLTGLEWAMGIPGTIGGAVYGNAGAYGHSISESVEKVITISPSDYLSKEYNRNECGFIYRGSAFKKMNEIIIGVILELKEGSKDESQKKMKEAIDDRRKKTPPYPSAGCPFKNYRLKSKNPDEDPLVKKFPELNGKIRAGKIGVGYMIDGCGLRGRKVGQAMVSEQHGNWIINLGGATAKDVMELISIVKKEVKEKWGIELEEETRFLGF